MVSRPGAELVPCSWPRFFNKDLVPTGRATMRVLCCVLTEAHMWLGLRVDQLVTPLLEGGLAARLPL